MNFSDHAPAHFHAWYGEYKVIVSIKDSIVKGEMPGRALSMILEWLRRIVGQLGKGSKRRHVS